MVAYISLFISLVCVVLLIFVLIKTRSYFTTDNLIKKIQIYMEKRIKEIDQISLRDIELVREASKNIRNLLKEADETMEKYQQATERLRNMIAEVEKAEDNQINTSIYDTDILISKTTEEIEEKRPSLKKTQDNYSFTRPVVISGKMDDIPATNNYIRVNKKSKSDFSFNVKDLYEKGFDIEEIAEQLSCSVTEVQYVIDLGL